MRGLREVLGTALVLGSLAWAADVHRRLGLALYTEQYLAAMLALGLALAFVHAPMRPGPRRGLPWYDAAAALLGFGAAAYLAVRYPDLVDRVHYLPADALVIGAILFVLCLEGMRRTTGMSLVVWVLAFVAYGLVGHLVPGQFRARPVEADRLLTYLTIDTNALLGVSLDVALTVVIPFVFFGQMLFASGGGTFFSDLSLALMGRLRGGAAKIAIMASSLFGTISGTVVANIMVDGAITIPLMSRSGYPRHVAAAIEAVASTGGQIMPPVMGVVAFLMAEYLQVPYRDVALAAVLPAVLYYVALFFQVDLEAARRGITRVEESRIPRLGTIIRAGWFFALPFAVLLGSLFWLNQQAEVAALYAAAVVIVSGLVVGYRGNRMQVWDVLRELPAIGVTCIDIIMICASAGFLVGVMSVSGLGFTLTLALLQLSEGNLLVLLLVTAALSVVLGLGMPSVAIYILQVVLFVPALVKAGVSPMAAHMFIFYFGMMSILTPPVAIGAFAAATLAKADPMRTGWTAARIGWVAYVIPFMFVFSPSLLLEGDLRDLLLVLPLAVVAVWLVSASTVGYCARPLAWPSRAALAVVGLALLVPARFYPGGAWAVLGVLALGAVLVGREVRAARRSGGAVPRVAGGAAAAAIPEVADLRDGGAR